MKQETDKGKNSDAKDWKVVEQEVADASSAATRDRLNKPASSYSDEFARLGMRMPAAGASAARANDLSAEAQALRAMQREDGFQGLNARASHSREVSALTDLRAKVLRDETLAPGTRDGMLKMIRERLDRAGKEYSEALQQSPEGFMAARVADLRSYRRQSMRGRIVETEYVKEKKGEILTALGSARMCFISGETGTGKTEVARLVAREFSGKEELVVRGYAGIGSSEIYGHMTLTDSAEKRMENARKEIDLAERSYKEKFPDASEQDLAAVARGVLAKGGVTTTEYILGAVYRAAKEGRVVIIDEANYIPPELLASMNDIMTKRPGEKINVQQGGVGPITVQKGFGAIFTGNINPPTGPTAKRYHGRKEFDAAFTDRVPNVSYERLPQAVQGRPADYALHDKQLFAVAVSTALLPPVRTGADTVEKLESRYGTVFLPGGPGQGLDTLWRFAQFAAVTQASFHGEIKDGDAHGFRSEATNVGFVPKVQLSNRGMMRVIEQWRDDGFQRELDYYIAKDLFSRATDPKDRAYLYQQAQFKGFFQTEGWAQNPDYSPEAVQRFDVKIPVNDAPPSDIVPAREVLECLYGAIPMRTVWPSGQEAQAQETQNEMAGFVAVEAELAAWKATWGAHLATVAETHRFTSSGE